MTNYFGNDIKDEEKDVGCTYSSECAGEVDGVRWRQIAKKIADVKTFF